MKHLQEIFVFGFLCFVKTNFGAQIGPNYADLVMLRNDKGELLDKCNARIRNCVRRIVIPGPTSGDEIFERASKIPLSKHCSIVRKALNCMRTEFNKRICADIPKHEADHLKKDLLPNLEDSLEYVCKTEFKKFKNNQRCLMTAQVVNGVQDALSNCPEGPDQHASRADLEEFDKLTACERHAMRLELIFNCVGEKVEELCGKTARAITTRLHRKARGRQHHCKPTN